MKNLGLKMPKIVIASVVLWIIFLLPIAFPDLVPFRLSLFTGIAAMLAFPLTIIAIVQLMAGGFRRREAHYEEFSRSSWVMILPLIILASLAISTYSAIGSYSASFVSQIKYEYVANLFAFIAIISILILSGVQKNIYWVSRMKSIKFDERQIRERQEIFEKSYKIGAWLVLISALLFYAFVLPIIIDMIKDSHTSMFISRTHIFWPILNVALTLFALPLILATWKKPNKIHSKN